MKHRCSELAPPPEPKVVFVSGESGLWWPKRRGNALTSVVGPTAWWRCGAVVAMLEADKIPVTVELPDFARSIGVGAGTGNNAVIRKALQRLEHFGLARPIEGGYAVRTWVAPLIERQLARASQRVRLVHSRMMAQRYRHRAS